MDEKYIKAYENTLDFLRQPKVQWSIVFVVFMIILITSTSIRVSNIDLLVDKTTNRPIPMALDPYYFLRLAETEMENGYRPSDDYFRHYPHDLEEVGYSFEVFPTLTIYMYRVYSLFDSEIDFRYFVNISNVIFFVFTLLSFFFFVLVLTKNKYIALVSLAFLAYSPAYLYRSMAGFFDHDNIGMGVLFFSFIIFILTMNYLGKKKVPYYYSIIFGILIGLATAFTIAIWTGVANFLFILIPVVLFLVWIFSSRKKDLHFQKSFLTYYFLWIISTIVFGLFFDFPLRRLIGFFIDSEGIISLGVIVFALVDFMLLNIKSDFIKKQYRILYSFLVTAILGFFGLVFMGKNPFSLVFGLLSKFLNPFVGGRVGSTVAENQVPFLTSWISQMGDLTFYLFFAGVLLLGYQLTKRIKDIRYKVGFLSFYVLMVVGILYSKYSSGSILNGENFISIAFYFVPLFSFWIFFFYIYIKEDFSFSRNQCFLFVLILLTIILGRGAIRLFFSTTPFAIVLAGYVVFSLYEEARITKDKTLRFVFIMLFLVFLIMSFVIVNNNYSGIKASASHMGPSANEQWQNTMKWVRENTSEEAIFGHWWDYGYWVQTLGERRAIADGGHFQSRYHGTHKLARYALTSPRPETALSYFKSIGVDYFLIDPTDLGKYSAYSKIGSDDNWDRFSMIPIGVYDPKSVQETANESILIYNVQVMVDSDIEYDSNNDGVNDIFLPGPSYDSLGNPTPRSFLGGVFFKMNEGGLNQPEGVYIYNERQYRIPIRYVYLEGQIYDFGSGLDAVLRVVPRVEVNNQGMMSLDPIGAMIYLSPKVQKSMYAQLYLLDDAFGNYQTIELAHSELDAVGRAVSSQGNSKLGEIFYYQGLRGPIRIWNTQNIPDEINFIEEFYYKHDQNEFAMLDDFDFISDGLDSVHEVYFRYDSLSDSVEEIELDFDELFAIDDEEVVEVEDEDGLLEENEEEILV